jgi:hypothetical protein
MLFCPELCTVGGLLIRILAKNFIPFAVVQNCNRYGLLLQLITMHGLLLTLVIGYAGLLG